MAAVWLFSKQINVMEAMLTPQSAGKLSFSRWKSNSSFIEELFSKYKTSKHLVAWEN